MRICQVMAIAAAALLVAPTAAFGAIINGDAADAVLEGNRDVEPQETGTGVATVGGFTLKVGGNTNNNVTGGRAAAYVFQLPNFGAIPTPFITASLTFSVGAINANTTLNGDLYGLGRRAAADLLASDYYLGDLDVTDAALLEDNILNPATPADSTVISSAGGSAALAAYLNAQYAGGLGAGEYVFLRFSPDDPSSAPRGYNVYTANAATSTDPAIADNVPFITYTAIPEPASCGLLALGGLAFVVRRRSS